MRLSRSASRQETSRLPLVRRPWESSFQNCLQGLVLSPRTWSARSLSRSRRRAARSAGFAGARLSRPWGPRNSWTGVTAGIPPTKQSERLLRCGFDIWLRIPGIRVTPGCRLRYGGDMGDSRCAAHDLKNWARPLRHFNRGYSFCPKSSVAGMASAHSAIPCSPTLELRASGPIPNVSG